MKLCKNCKYFKRNTGEHDNNNYGRCLSNKLLYAETTEDGVKNWDKEKDERHILKDTDLLLFMDAEDYDADVEVGQDYGCIHYEEAEK